MLSIKEEIYEFFEYYPTCFKIKHFVKDKLILLIFCRKIKIPNIN